MLDIEDFIEERGGDPKKIKESQLRRGASTELVDEVIELWKDDRAGKIKNIEVPAAPAHTLFQSITKSAR